MSSSRPRLRALLAPALAAALVGCGFQPLYMKDAQGSGVTGDLARVRVVNVHASHPEYDRLGQQMNNLLRQRLNPDGTPAEPLYRLETNMSVLKERTGIQITEEATRARLTVSASFRLIDLANNQTVYAGSEQSTNSYNVADSQFATLTAENDAGRRAVREISDSIRLRLGIYFQRAESG
jgi:LPS-assembly lipoprotein